MRLCILRQLKVVAIDFSVIALYMNFWDESSDPRWIWRKVVVDLFLYLMATCKIVFFIFHVDKLVKIDEKIHNTKMF